MMNTAERAAALSKACGIAAETLLGVVTTELGNAESLDRFVAYGDIYAQAHPVSPVLHIVAGNTPEPAIQTIMRGLLIGAFNQLKLPSDGIKEIDEFINLLPNELKSMIEVTTSREVAGEWLTSAAAVIVFGSDETIWEIQSKVSPHQIYIAHGHKVSLAIIDSDNNKDAARLAALDIASHDQRGCLSPHDIYVAPGERPRSFAAELARTLAKINESDPPTNRRIEENARIDHLRRSYSFRASCDTSVQIWQSEETTDWTVVFEEDPQFAASPLGRFAFVKPLPENLDQALFVIRDHLSTIALHPFSLKRAQSLSNQGATRICPLGSAQSPSSYWHHDGFQSLAPLVSWTNAG